MNDISFSVIIPTFNRCLLLKRAIESVLNQTHTNFQIIVVDDGSSDSTSDVINNYCDSRISYIKNTQNRGTMFSLQRGIELSTGDYCCFLGDDDELLPNALDTVAHIIGKLNDNKIGLLRFDIIDREKGVVSGSGLSSEGFVTFKQLICDEMKGDHWVIFNQRLLNEEVDYSRLYGAEIFYWTDIQKVSKCYYCNQTLYIANREHGIRLTSPIATPRKMENYLFTRYIYFRKYSDDLRKHCLNRYWYCAANVGLYLSCVGEYEEGSKMLLNAMKNNFNVRTIIFYFLGQFIIPNLNIIYTKFNISKIFNKFSYVIYYFI